MDIPFMRLDRQYLSLKEDLLPRIDRLFGKGRVLQSEEVLELECNLAGMHRVRHCIAVNSGTDALTIALRALRLEPGTPIAVPAFSFVASASAIVHAGCIPRFVDVEPQTLMMKESVVLDWIVGRRVKAVMGVHLYGQLMDMDRICEVAHEHKVPVVEDAAQALGSGRNNRPPGSWGDVTCLSFDPTKVIGAFGSGGAILTNSDRIASEARLLRYHGHRGGGVFGCPGFNSQMDSVQAVILLEKLKHLGEWQTRRSEVVMRILKRIEGSRLDPIHTLSGNLHNHHKFVLRSPNRDAVVEFLKERGIEARVHYPLPLHKQPCFAGMGTEADCPNAERAAKEVFSLPIYAELSEQEVERIGDVLLEFNSSVAAS